MKKTFLTFVLCLLFISSKSQDIPPKFIIQGRVLDSKNAVIPFANVYIEGTTIGTLTDANGRYILKNIPVGKYYIVVSMVDFKIFLQRINLFKTDIKLDIVLQDNTKLLPEVKVLAGKDRQWERQIKEFEKDFLGKDFIPEEVKIINREVIDFEYGKSNSGYYKAKASEPLIIENRSLGYQVSYILESFKRTSETIYYQGISRFEILTPKYEYEATYWKKNQINAFNGSLPHFLKALVSNKLKEAGFDAFFVNPNYIHKTFQKVRFYDLTNNRHIPFAVSEIVKSMENYSSLFEIPWKFPMEVVYTRNFVSKSAFPDAPYPFSTLTPKSSVIVTANGNLIEPFSIEISGEMAKNGVAKLLPLDFENE